MVATTTELGLEPRTKNWLMDQLVLLNYSLRRDNLFYSSKGIFRKAEEATSSAETHFRAEKGIIQYKRGLLENCEETI